MSKFQEWQKQKWQFVNYDRQIMIITAAWKAAGSVMEGTNASLDKLSEFAEELIERFFLMEMTQKAPIKTIAKKTGQMIKKEDISVEENIPF